MKRQKDICEGLEKITEQETITSLKPKKKSSEQMSKQEMITSPKSQNKNNKTILHKGEPKKTKDGLLPGKERKRKLAETKLKTSSLSADKPDQKIVQQSLLLLKGHKQPQLKVYKLDATQAPDEPPHGESTTTSLQSKDNTLEQRQKGTKSKTMLKTGVKKNVGRPRKNQKVLSLLPALFTSVSTETQPSKPKATRKRSAPSKVETEGVISSHSRRALACKDCGESFSEVSTLQVHKATMHAVQSPELTYTNGNIFEGVTGSDLCKPQKVSEKSFERKLNQNAFDMHVASDWDMEAEVGEMVSGDKEGRVSFPALNPSPSLPLAFAAVEGDAYEQRSLQSHDDPPEHSTLSHSPPQIVSPGSFISDQVKTILSGQSPPHLKPIETLDRSHQTQQSDTGEHMAGEDKPESQDHLEEDTPKLFLPSDCTSEHQAPVEEEIKEELLLDVNLVTVGEQNEREGQNLAHASSSKNIDRDSQMLDPSSQCEVENNQEPVAHSRDRNVRTSETRPNTQSFSSSTKPPEIKQEEEETLVQKKVVGKKGVRQKNLSRGKRRASGRGRRSLDGLKRVRSDKDTEECQVVYPQHSLTIDSEVNDAVEAGAPQPCQSAAPSLEPEICSRSEPHKDVACATSAPSLPYFPEESPEEQVVFELESVTTSVEEVLKSEEGLRIEVVGEQDRNDGQSPGIILERFLTSRQRDGEDDLQCSDLNLIPHTSQSIPSLEQQCQQSIKSVLVKQEINLNQNDNQDTQGLRHTHNASGLQTDVGERIGSSTVSLDSSVRQCIFYPVKEEEREVLLEQCHPGASSSPVQRGQFVEHQAMPSSGGLYEISSAESEPHVTRGRGMAISDSEEGELDTEQQDTSKLLEFLLNSSDEEDSVNIEFPDPYPEPEVLVKAGLQNGQKHGQLHTNETANNLPASSHPAHLRPKPGSPYTQRDEQGNDFGKPIDYFLKYFGQDTWADIANCTNKTSDLQNPVTAKEVSQFVGIHIAMGTLKFPSLKLYWQDFTKVPLIAEAMSASRYSQLSCKLKLASSPLDSVRHVRHDKDRSKSQADSNSSTYMSRYPGSDENRAPETPSTDPLAGPARPGSESSGHSCTSHSQIQDQSPKLVPSRNSVANGNGQSCADQQNCHTVKIDPLWRVRPLLHRIQAGCLMLRQEGDHGVDQYSIPLTARAGNYNNNQPSLHSTVLVGSSGMILNLDLSLDLSEKEATVEKMVPRDGMVYLCKQELSTPAMLERLLGAGVHGAGKVGGARGQIGDEFVSSDGKLMLRRSHYGFILSTIGKGQQYMASLVNNFDQAEKAAQLNRDLRNLYRTPHSSSAPSSWPQVVLWYLTDVALVNSWLHYRQGRGLGPELLNLMAFRLEVSKALILSSGSDTQDSVPPQPPAQTLHTQGALSNPSLLQVGPLPDPSIRYDGSGHWPEQLGEGEEGRCRFGGCERTSRVRCLKCCVFLCISRNHNCFLNFHSHGFF